MEYQTLINAISLVLFCSWNLNFSWKGTWILGHAWIWIWVHSTHEWQLIWNCAYTQNFHYLRMLPIAGRIPQFHNEFHPQIRSEFAHSLDGKFTHIDWKDLQFSIWALGWSRKLESSNSYPPNLKFSRKFGWYNSIKSHFFARISAGLGPPGKIANSNL